VKLHVRASRGIWRIEFQTCVKQVHRFVRQWTKLARLLSGESATIWDALP
jgi:hypothetical protein